MSITLRYVTPQDPCLAQELRLLALEQGKAHDTHLPDTPDSIPVIVRNFQTALQDNLVEIWRTETPAPGSAALFLSPLNKDGQSGIQIDDIIVMPPYRRQGIGTMLIDFAAALAQSRGLSFVTWECEEGNTAQHMYRHVGAQPRTAVKPFRLNRYNITNLTHTETNACTDRFSFLASSRFSLFRTVNYGIHGYDMNSDEWAHGLQIENITINNANEIRTALGYFIKAYEKIKRVDFIDLILPETKQALALISQLDAAQNSYSGNPALLWELSGDSFQKSAERGQSILAQALTTRPT